MTKKLIFGGQCLHYSPSYFRECTLKLKTVSQKGGIECVCLERISTVKQSKVHPSLFELDQDRYLSLIAFKVIYTPGSNYTAFGWH